MSPAALTRSASPTGAPHGAGEGVGWAAATMAEEGIVHFSVPARVPTKFSGGAVPEEAGVGVEGGGGSGVGGVGGGGGGVFVVELWQVVNRARRVSMAVFFFSCSVSRRVWFRGVCLVSLSTDVCQGRSLEDNTAAAVSWVCPLRFHRRYLVHYSSRTLYSM